MYITLNFSNSLVIHQVKTVEIITEHRFLWFYSSVFVSIEKTSNTRDSVSSHFQTPRISSKILRCASYFQLSSLCLDIPMKHSLMFEISLHNSTKMHYILPYPLRHPRTPNQHSLRSIVMVYCFQISLGFVQVTNPQVTSRRGEWAVKPKQESLLSYKQVRGMGRETQTR